MSSNIEEFLTREEEEKIISAIQAAELKTTGEIRVHLEKSTTDVEMRSLEVFKLLKMNNTKQSNGVLFYFAVDDRKFRIIGDSGIHRVVGQNFWVEIKEVITTQIKAGNTAAGIIEGIEMTGIKLAQYFPWNDGDINELPDEISRG
ncbi:MAG: TPM domain-containing protein [Nonlabens sp.]